MRGLMMGRFQPFHLGHLELVKQILSECDEVIIALTGSQFNYIQKDPFTAGERIEMIHQSLKDEGIDLSRSYDGLQDKTMCGVINQDSFSFSFHDPVTGEVTTLEDLHGFIMKCDQSPISLDTVLRYTIVNS